MNALFDIICESDIGRYAYTDVDPHEELVFHLPCAYADTWTVST